MKNFRSATPLNWLRKALILALNDFRSAEARKLYQQRIQKQKDYDRFMRELSINMGGVYKARERIHRAVADARLLANPASWSRVADSSPN